MADTAKKAEVPMPGRTIRHDTFTIERSYAASRRRSSLPGPIPSPSARGLSKATADVESYEQDFRVGGHERSSFASKTALDLAATTPPISILCPSAASVVAYTMAIEGKIMSASLATTSSSRTVKARAADPDRARRASRWHRQVRAPARADAAGLLVKLGQYLEAAKAATSAKCRFARSPAIRLGAVFVWKPAKKQRIRRARRLPHPLPGHERRSLLHRSHTCGALGREFILGSWPDAGVRTNGMYEWSQEATARNLPVAALFSRPPSLLG